MRYVIGLALSALGNISSEEMAREPCPRGGQALEEHQHVHPQEGRPVRSAHSEEGTLRRREERRKPALCVYALCVLMLYAALLFGAWCVVRWYVLCVLLTRPNTCFPLLLSLLLPLLRPQVPELIEDFADHIASLLSERNHAVRQRIVIIFSVAFTLRNEKLQTET